MIGKQDNQGRSKLLVILMCAFAHTHGKGEGFPGR